MIGLTPLAFEALWNSYAPNVLPWSVTAIAGIPISAQPLNRSLTRAAPSSIEYSECTCRWTNESLPAAALPGMPVQPPSLVHQCCYGRPAVGEVSRGTTIIAPTDTPSVRRAPEPSEVLATGRRRCA